MEDIWWANAALAVIDTAWRDRQLPDWFYRLCRASPRCRVDADAPDEKRRGSLTWLVCRRGHFCERFDALDILKQGCETEMSGFRPVAELEPVKCLRFPVDPRLELPCRGDQIIVVLETGFVSEYV